jgi:hypothetical protein
MEAGESFSLFVKLLQMGILKTLAGFKKTSLEALVRTKGRSFTLSERKKEMIVSVSWHTWQIFLTI